MQLNKEQRDEIFNNTLIRKCRIKLISDTVSNTINNVTIKQVNKFANEVQEERKTVKQWSLFHSLLNERIIIILSSKSTILLY